MTDDWEMDFAAKALRARRRSAARKNSLDRVPVPDMSAENLLRLQAVCTEHDIPLWALFSPSRLAKIARARQVSMQRLYRASNMSTPAIGQIFGRDHTTVLHAIKTVEGDTDYLERYAKKMAKQVCQHRTNMVQLSVG
jgi:chromosomal replication initiator protein